MIHLLFAVFSVYNRVLCWFFIHIFHNKGKKQNAIEVQCFLSSQSIVDHKVQKLTSFRVVRVDLARETSLKNQQRRPPDIALLSGDNCDI